MKKLLLFGGTGEATDLVLFLNAHGCVPTVCVATDYGAQLLAHNGVDAQVRCGRLDEADMEALLRAEQPDLVLDATHPYAKIVTETIKTACAGTKYRYFRLLRPSLGAEEAVVVADATAAAEFLNTVDGNVLLTTGSKELATYTAVTDFETRIFARVLPSAQVLTACEGIGFRRKQLIAMEGPFSQALNVAMLQQYGCQWLVTKDTGNMGGLEEKRLAAKQARAGIVLIHRPTEEEGSTLEETKTFLADFCGFTMDKSLENNPIQQKNTRKAALVQTQDLVQDKRLHNKKQDFFPFFTGVKGKKVLMIGGGKIALRRLKTLSRFSFDVTLISREIPRDTEEFCRENHISFTQGDARDEDLQGFAYVFICIDDPVTAVRLAKLCKEQGILVNSAHDKGLCDFYFPALLEKEGAVIAINAGGENHGLAKALRQRMEDL